MAEFWIPKNKWALVGELVKVYPNDKSKFQAMKIRQLIAIFCRVRKTQFGINK